MKVFLENIVQWHGDLLAAAAWVWRHAASIDRRTILFASWKRRTRPPAPVTVLSPITFSHRSRPRLGWLALLCRCRQAGR